MATTGIPALLDVGERIGEVLSSFLARRREEMLCVAGETLPLIDHAERLMAGGKRLRPAFCWWAYRGAGAEDDLVAPAAAALELFQAAALIHDDVMDDSDTRRGAPAVHRSFARMHEDAGWRGDPRRFGVAGALLTGDLCLSWSDELFATVEAAPDRWRAARSVFDQMRTQLMSGQYLDMLEQVAPDGMPVAAPASTDGSALSAVARAKRVICYKSAKYSVEQPLLLGAALAGADADLTRCYSRFGLLLGEAFQLRDDMLGVFGDPDVTGKPAGDDLREGKRTLLVAFAAERATMGQRDLLELRLGNPLLDEQGVAEVREVLVATGAVDRVEQLIAEDVAGAQEVLRSSPVTPEARAALESLAVRATDRVA